MEHNNSKEREVLVDIESGGNGFPKDINSNAIKGNKQGKRLLNKLTSGILKYDILARGGPASSFDCNIAKPSQDSQANVELLVDKNSGRQNEEQMLLLGKEHAKGKPKSINSKKASKPPRPPKGPSLDASDLKLVKEISELVMKKRARREHIRALKRARAVKLSSLSSSSTNSTLFGMTITIVFFLIILLQGFSWKSSSTSILQGSPEPATEANGLISVQVRNNILSNYSIAPNSESPSFVERLVGSGSIFPG